jgi:hypothetical protein
MPKDVFDDDDDLSEKEDKGGPLERFQKQVKELTEDSEVHMEEDATGKEVAVVQTRADKKRERFTLREENERLRKENDEAKTRLARLEGAFMARQNVRDDTDEPDDGEEEFERKYSELQKQHTEAYRQLIAKGHQVTQADKDEYQRMSAKIERQRIEMTADRLIERRQAALSQRTGQDVMRASIRARHEDVYAKPQAVQYAEGEFRKLRAMGKPDNADTLDAAMNAARRAFGMSKEPPPSDVQKSRFAGSPRGNAAPGREPGVVRMTPELRRMANAKYSHVKDEEQRYKLWANREGKALLEDKD